MCGASREEERCRVLYALKRPVYISIIRREKECRRLEEMQLAACMKGFARNAPPPSNIEGILEEVVAVVFWG